MLDAIRMIDAIQRHAAYSLLLMRRLLIAIFGHGHTPDDAEEVIISRANNSHARYGLYVIGNRY